MCTGEAFPMPGIIPVGYTSLGNHLGALDTLGSELIFITFCTVDIMLLGDKRLRSNGVLACTADKTFLMPLSCLILHLLHTCSKDITAAVTPGSKLGIITWTTINPVSLAAKLFIYEAASTLVTEETGFMPMLLFV